MAKRVKGIFCLETDSWWSVEDRTTMEPVLKLLESAADWKVPYIHRDVATREEFEHYLRQWRQKKLSSDYPVLYLGFHGAREELYVGDRRRRNSRLSLTELAECLGSRCKGELIHFGSCGTLGGHGLGLKTFLVKTGAVAITGYRRDVTWVETAAFELLLLSELQFFTLTRGGMEALKKRLKDSAPGLFRNLQFRIEIG